MQLGGVIRDAVLAHRIGHHVKLLSGSDQRVNEGELVIRMYVVVIRSENDQDTAVQLFCERD